eukprot:TRINITY_DN9423_c0_g1_i2.p2 TRINITY_DN9423_c0_g1~~TRINITY_DN9423_c0_g1_i2.p2  ORF type:complete len:125 (+),score=35.27 TRINITY_DN9423_c0_g1_i2:77-451(+)
MFYTVFMLIFFFFFFFQAEDGIRDVERSRGLGDVYKRQGINAEYMGHKYVERLVLEANSHMISKAIMLIVVLATIDAVISLKEAFDIPKVLAKISLLKCEIEEVYRQINELLESGYKDLSLIHI